MAKKKNNNDKYAILALLLGVGGYVVYKQYEKNKDKGQGDATPPKEEDIVLAVEQAKQRQSTQSFTPYQIQVMTLQALLQISIDGNAGKVTLANLDYYFANYNKTLDIEKAKAENYPELRTRGYGLLSSDNISQYISNLMAGTTPRQNFFRGQTSNTTTSSTDAARITKAKSIITAFNNGSSKRLKFSKTETFQMYKKNSSGGYDKASNFFGNNTLSQTTGSVYLFSKLEATTIGMIRAEARPIVGDVFYVYISPYNVNNA